MTNPYTDQPSFSPAVQIFYGGVNEGGTFTVLARVVGLQGTGTQVLPKEGNCFKQIDITSITCKIFNLGENKDNHAGTHITLDPVLTPSGNIYDVLQTNGWPTDQDTAGYNFRHDVDGSYVESIGTDETGSWFLLEYCFTLTDGSVVWLKVKVKTYQIQS